MRIATKGDHRDFGCVRSEKHRRTDTVSEKWRPLNGELISRYSYQNRVLAKVVILYLFFFCWDQEMVDFFSNYVWELKT